MTILCPVCLEEAYVPVGAPDCEYLIIEEFPELVIPTGNLNTWKDEWTPKKILVNELSKAGLNPLQFIVASVYPHYPDGEPNERCYNFGLEYVTTEFIPRMKGVIVLGGNLCKTFTGYELKQVQGLSGVPSALIPDGDVPRVFLPTIRSMYSTTFGEFSLGMKRFAEQLRKQ